VPVAVPAGHRALLGVGLGAARPQLRRGHGVTSNTSEWGHTVVNVGGTQCRAARVVAWRHTWAPIAILAAYASRTGHQRLWATDMEAQLAELVGLAATPGAAAEVLANHR